MTGLHKISFASTGNDAQDSKSQSTPHSRHVSSPLTRTYASRSLGSADQRLQDFTMSAVDVTERTGLLTNSPEESVKHQYDTVPSSPKSRILSRKSSHAGLWNFKSHMRRPSSKGGRLSPRMPLSGFRTPRLHRSVILNDTDVKDRAWYDQFTSTDWLHDSIADGYRVLELKKRKGFRGRLWLIFDAAQGWILVALIGFLTAAVAYLIDIAETATFDLKRGYCTKGWHKNMIKCCKSNEVCPDWRSWSQIIHPLHADSYLGDYLGFVLGCVFFALSACVLTLLSKTVVPLQVASTFDENLGADSQKVDEHVSDTSSESSSHASEPSAMTYYAAAGSGVAEVKVILSGFVLHGYLGLATLLIKCPALIFSVASGMSIGKEGPFVHIATCIGNIACRMFSKYNLNDGKRREVLSAAAASGVTVAFGSPLGGVLFSLEEVSYYFPPKTLFRTFFCCIVAALSLKFLNPYGTNKIVPFEVRYFTEWQTFELAVFAFLGVVGGLAGAAFIKLSRIWATTFRRLTVIKSNPWLEVLIVALITGLISFWNRYASLPVADLLSELASPCGGKVNSGLCPNSKEQIPLTIGYISIAFVIKAFLTVITFGTKVPAGIYVPSMVCGGLMGRIVGHAVQYAVLSLPKSSAFGHCSATDDIEHCITPGVYALVAAGATMCGVTRLSVTLAVILFELTGSLDYVLPFAIGVLVAKWTADLVEPHSIYDLLIDMNSYPFMDNRRTPLFDGHTDLGDIAPRFNGGRIIDVSISPYINASELRNKLGLLHNTGEFDSGIPIVRDKVLVGFISAPDLEFALDRIDSLESETLCLMTGADEFSHVTRHRRWFNVLDDNSDSESMVRSPSDSNSNTDTEDQNTPEVDFVPYVDPAPMTLDARSPLNMVYQCFSKLGLKYICVVEAGEYRGMVHKKLFVKYIKTCEAKEN